MEVPFILLRMERTSIHQMSESCSKTDRIGLRIILFVVTHSDGNGMGLVCVYLELCTLLSIRAELIHVISIFLSALVVIYIFVSAVD